MIGRIELAGGLLTGVLGLAGLSLALSLVRVGQALPVIVFFVVVALALVGFVVGTYLHGRRGIRAGLVLLWVCVVLLVALTVLSAASVGLFLAPAMLSAFLVAAAVSVDEADPEQ